MVTLKILNRAFGILGIELIWGVASSGEKYFYFIISDITKCPLQFSDDEKFGTGDQLLESFGYGWPLNHKDATGWLEEAVYQIADTLEDRGGHKYTAKDLNLMRLVFCSSLSKNYEVKKVWRS
jgi:gluconate kinase